MINGNPRARFETSLLIAGLFLMIAASYLTYSILAGPESRPEATEVVIELNSYQMTAGDQLTLRVLVSPMRATLQGINEWLSSNPQVVSVYPGGIIIAKRPGQAIITVRRGQLTDSCKITVSANK